MITVAFGRSQLEGDWGPGCGYGIACWGGMPMGIPGWPPGAPVGQSQFRLALWITLSTRSASSLTYSIKDINMIDLLCWTNRFKFQTISSTENTQRYMSIHIFCNRCIMDRGCRELLATTSLSKRLYDPTSKDC